MIQNIFLFSNTSTPFLGSPQAPYLVDGGRLLGVKRRRRDGDHFRPSRDYVKNGKSHNSNPPISFQSVDRDFLYVSVDIKWRLGLE
jgi:hypothetical protein